MEQCELLNILMGTSTEVYGTTFVILNVLGDSSTVLFAIDV